MGGPDNTSIDLATQIDRLGERAQYVTDVFGALRQFDQDVRAAKARLDDVLAQPAPPV